MLRRKAINKISKKKLAEMIAEKETRKELCERAGGQFFSAIDKKGIPHYTCLNGRCEKCGERPDWRGLSVHEKKFRSHGGKLSLANSQMLCGDCHDKKHQGRSE